MKEEAWYPESKVYHDGSHYVAIPHTTNRYRKRPKPKEQVFVVREEGAVQTASKLPTLELLDDDEVEDCPFDYEETVQEKVPVNADMGTVKEKKERPARGKRVTRGSEFNRLYDESRNKTRSGQKAYLIKNMRKLFKTEKQAEDYVIARLRNKQRALITRRIRFMRKAYMHNFNYFVTFTYDDKKHTEESFQKKLKKCLQNFHTRNEWKYMGVWERAPKTKRLHFHGLLYIPEGTMPGEMTEKKSYSTTAHRMQKTNENSFFTEKFGRNDFEGISRDSVEYTSEIQYILKYIEKTGERILYSRGLPMYVISDINNDDVIVRTGEEDKKLVLFDDFTCWDEGEYIGKMSEATKKKLRKAN